MIMILFGAIAFGSLILFERNGKEALGSCVFSGTLGLAVLVAVFYRTLDYNTKITRNLSHYSK